ncbi:HECT-domain (ubiquitin-transferase), putative [Plasmodium ovale curtisi]|uniref:HECT-domain (Ubiquitin-transferase), putative n=1 Tax=Plasmodium ovale curtisi TaxID=864141 RepID=A0A1A8WA08_PLAOA|nr:HECT-domain (ubiquitin-transferase), putative [Plasmodium ovale curtisi]
MNDLHSVYANTSEKDKKIISEKLINILDNFQDTNKCHVSEFVVVSRTRFLKSISNHGEFLLLQSSSRLISNYESILRLLYKSKVYLECVKCLQSRIDNLDKNKKQEDEILTFINYLEAKKKKYYYYICGTLIKYIITSLKKNDNVLGNDCNNTDLKKNEKNNIDMYDKTGINIDDKPNDSNIYETNKLNNNDEKSIIEPFNELEEYGNYLCNVLNQMDSKSWKDKKYEEYLKMISLNDEIIIEEHDKNDTSENSSFANIAKAPNNMILLPKYLENVRNSIYNHQNKSILEVKFMVENAMSNNSKAPLFKTGKIISEMIPSPDYEKYGFSTKYDSLNNSDNTSLVQDMIFKFFNLSKNQTNNFISSNEYYINIFDVFNIIFKGINSIKIENEEIHIFLKQLLINTKLNYSYMLNKKLENKQSLNHEKQNYIISPLNIYKNSNVCKEVLKYAIGNNDIALTSFALNNEIKYYIMFYSFSFSHLHTHPCIHI